MTIIQNWFEATPRDRMFLVMNGVPYDTAQTLDTAEVLRLAADFKSLHEDGWLHPAYRTMKDRAGSIDCIKKVAVEFQGWPMAKVPVRLVQEALQEATSCRAEAEFRRFPDNFGSELDSIIAHVYHPDGRITCLFSRGDFTIH